MTRQTLVMTRPRAAAERFVGGLSDDAMQDVEVIYAPLVRIVGTGAPVDLSGYGGVIFTSANAVAFAPEANGRRAYCVGSTTAAKARAAGWDVKAVEQNAEALIATFAKAMPKGPLMHLAGRHRRGGIDTRLSEMGVQVDVQVLYDQPLIRLSEEVRELLSGEGRLILPLFSPRTATHLASEIRTAPHVIAIVMSDAIAFPLRDVQFADIVKAAAPTGEEMALTVELQLRRNRFP
ncbi:MAG: uroporphyrinogen-III synthase [Sulfitobacter sp.]